MSSGGVKQVLPSQKATFTLHALYRKDFRVFVCAKMFSHLTKMMDAKIFSFCTF